MLERFADEMDRVIDNFGLGRGWSAPRIARGWLSPSAQHEWSWSPAVNPQVQK